MGGHNALARHQLLKRRVLRHSPKTDIEHSNAHSTPIQTSGIQGHSVEVGGLAASQQVVVGRNRFGRGGLVIWRIGRLIRSHDSASLRPSDY